jgi:fucose 4-O-acetylase-like acetyltransferase
MERNKFLDSSKFILVFLVVFAHTCEYNLFVDYVKFKIYVFLSTFTIPLFIVISGYLSKRVNWEKYKKFFVQFLLIYIVFQIIYSDPVPAIFGGPFNLEKLLIPIGPLWYIVGLLLWRFLVCIIVKFRISFIWSFSVSLALSLALGFIQDKIPVSRIFVFIPFFILGYYTPVDLPSKIKKMSKIYPFIYFSILAVLVLFFGDVSHAFSTFGEYPYKVFLTFEQGFFQRLLLFPVATLSCIAAYRLIPDTFHKLGSQSLAVFLLHIIFVFPIYRAILRSYNVVMPVYIDILVAMVITSICLLLARIKAVQYLVNPIMLFRKKETTHKENRHHQL